MTGTVPSIPLIVSSIMSKKLAAGADVIVLDVKCGSGAFMKTPEQARELAEGLTRVGKLAGRKCAAVITDMDEPLGFAVGNALEVKEAIDVLAGRTEAGELKSLCLTLGANMLTLSGLAADETEAKAKLEATIADGSALRKLAEMVEAQGGDSRAVYDFSLLPEAAYRRKARSTSPSAWCCTKRSATASSRARVSPRSTHPTRKRPRGRKSCCARAIRSRPIRSKKRRSSKTS